MCLWQRSRAGASVALHPEGVDRNRSSLQKTMFCSVRSPSTRRAWIEISKTI